MLIFKVMVCFLAVFRREDCVGGLPAVHDSPDNERVGQSQSVGSASNQGVANEPDISLGNFTDYASSRGEDIAGKVEAEISPGEILQPCEKRPVTTSESGNNLRDGTDRCKTVIDKSKSRKDQATTGTESHSAVTASQETSTQRFSSVYTSQDLQEKVEKNKDKFKTDLSAYLTDVLDAVVSGKGGASLLSDSTNVPGPEEDSIVRSRTSQDELPVEKRQRKSLGDVIKWQQSTNMRPTRTQYLVQNKRSTSEGSLKLPGNGGRRNFGRNARVQGPIRRQFDAGNQLQFAALNPVQLNAAVAYSKRPTPQQGLNLDLSRALYQLGPAQLHALKGVFDKVPPPTQNFKPIAPKQVAYAPPRIIYEAKIVPTPFMPFRTEQKTVDALSALLGQDPAKQLQGLNLILRKERPEEANTPSPAAVFTPEISRQGINDAVALGQAFVTPVPSVDINSELSDGTFRFSNGVSDPSEEIRPVIESPFDHKTPEYPGRGNGNLGHREKGFETSPIEEHREDGPSVVGELPGWDGETQENEGRYKHNRGEAYAARYDFGYHVKDYDSGNNFGHEEARDGVITNGRYHVLLPDGRIQNVKYHVDEGGYHAKVSYQLQNHSL